MELCKCGHPESEHYEYILNGHPQSRCRACDPMTGHRASGDVTVDMQRGSYMHAMYFTADHDYEPHGADSEGSDTA